MHSRSRLWALVGVALLNIAVPSAAQTLANGNEAVPGNFELLSGSSDAVPPATDDKDYYSEPTEEPDLFYSDLHPCPRACDGKHADEWDLFPTKDGLKFCAEPILFDLALYNQLDSPGMPTTLRACTSGDAHSSVNAASTSPEPMEARHRFLVHRHGPRPVRARRSSVQCIVGEDRPSRLQLSSFGSKNTVQWDATSTLLGHISEFFMDEATCHSNVLLGYLNGTIVGLYAGEAINKASVQNVIQAAQKSLAEDAISGFTAEICDPDHSSAHILGIVALAATDLASVQKTLRAWDNAECAGSAASARTVDVLIKAEPFTLLNHTMSNSTASALPLYLNATGHHLSSLVSRAACSVQGVVLGDNCETLAAKCGISLPAFKKYNPVEDMCTPTGLFEGMEVCCSEGSLPDRTKQPDKDG